MLLPLLASGFGSLWRHGTEPVVHEAHILPPFYFDVAITTTVVVCFILVFGMLLSLPGFSWKHRQIVVVYTSVLLMVTVGGVILVAQFSRGWTTSVVRTRTPFRAFDSTEIVGDLGFHGGLRGFNVTLNGAQAGGYKQHLSDHVAYVRYEEEFLWSDPWTQGRLGFGPFAGRVAQDFRAAQVNGAPTPILLTAEWWTLDGEFIRFGRYFRLAGLYTQYFLWVAFASWLCTTAVLFLGNARAAAFGLLHTGAWMVASCITYRELINWPKLEFIIPFRDGELHPASLGWTWYWVGLCGLLSILVGGIYLSYRALTARRQTSAVGQWLQQTLGVSQAALEHNFDRTTSARQRTRLQAEKKKKQQQRDGNARRPSRRGSKMAGGGPAMDAPVVAPTMAVLQHYKYGLRNGDDNSEAEVARRCCEARLLMRLAQVALSVVGGLLLAADDETDYWMEDEWRTLVLVLAAVGFVNGVIDFCLLADTHYKCLCGTSRRRAFGLPVLLAKTVVSDAVMAILAFTAGATVLCERYDDGPPPGPVSQWNLADLIPADAPDDTTLNGNADVVCVLFFISCFTYLVSLHFSWSTAVLAYKPDDSRVLEIERDSLLQNLAGELRTRQQASMSPK